MKITKVETINFKIPWRERLRKPMKWCGEQGEKGKIHKVYTDEGIVGLCDNPIEVSNIKQLLLGRDPLDFIFDDTVWPLQEALYDIVAQKLKIPIFKLLGKKCRDKVPACYWIHHFPPDILAEEAEIATEEDLKLLSLNHVHTTM